ncbi:MAG TPA: RDD family protein [Candidatus Hydrogenedentes bacterium]|nr:RDD family protein [Candidatus Hydrogenedentota bacterium]
MEDLARFETPENVTVSYPLAGPGTRFVAYFFDEVILFVAITLLLILLGLGSAVAGTAGLLGNMGGDALGAIAVSVVVVVIGFAQVGYFALCEWFMNGQTLGKRAVNVRVVMENGFSLSVAGVLVRNIIRLLDAIPLLWIVPIVTHKRQRFGDMVAGTIVISEEAHPLASVREQLGTRPAHEAQFTFTYGQLDKVDASELETIEMFLERCGRLGGAERARLAGQLAGEIIRRLELPPVDNAPQQERFLQDLVAASVRREVRELG